MNMINLGGYGGCALTTVIKKFNQPSYPFDWNVVNQQFVLNFFNSGGRYFFDFNESNLFRSNILLAPDLNGFLIHDFVNYAVQKPEVVLKYNRRIKRTSETILNLNQGLLLLRHYIDQDPYNDYHKSSWAEIPFSITPDDYNKWKELLTRIKEVRHGALTKMCLFTNNPNIKSDHPDIYISNIDLGKGSNWEKEAYEFISRI